MKLIIDIPTDHYNEIVFHDMDKLRECVKNGTVVENVADVDCDFGQEQFEKRRFLNEYLRKWLSSFNTNSATMCFTEIQELKKKVEKENE